MKAFWLAVLTAVLWGVVPIMEKIGLAKGLNPMLAVVLRTGGSTLGGLVLWAMISRNPEYAKNFTWQTAAWLMSGAAIASVIAQSFFYAALQQGEVSKIMPIAGSFPLISFILGIIIFGESFTVSKVIGVLCVVAGVILLK